MYIKYYITACEIFECQRNHHPKLLTDIHISNSGLFKQSVDFFEFIICWRGSQCLNIISSFVEFLLQNENTIRDKNNYLIIPESSEMEAKLTWSRDMLRVIREK